MITGKMKWLVFFLAASIAVNIFVVGVFLGKEFRPDRGPVAGPRERVEFNMRRLAAYLPEDQQVHLKNILRAHRKNLRGHFVEMRAREEQIKALLVAETVDMEALDAAISEHEAKMHELKEPLRSIIVEVIAKLDRETRVVLAEDFFSHRGGPAGGPQGRMRREPHPPHNGEFRPSHRTPPPEEEQGEGL